MPERVGIFADHILSVSNYFESVEIEEKAWKSDTGIVNDGGIEKGLLRQPWRLHKCDRDEGRKKLKRYCGFSICSA